jgi:hypothetical protein
LAKMSTAAMCGRWTSISAGSSEVKSSNAGSQ